MARYWTCVSLAFLLLLVSCGPPEALPTPDTVLPKGYSEKVVPKEFMDEMGFEFRAGEMWMRCIDCKEDWDGLNAHILETLGPQGYKETSSQWMSILDKGNNSSTEETEFFKKVFRMYSSKRGYSHIMLMDLKEMKEIGAQISTSGDFLIMVGIDHISNY